MIMIYHLTYKMRFYRLQNLFILLPSNLFTYISTKSCIVVMDVNMTFYNLSSRRKCNVTSGQYIIYGMALSTEKQ